MKNINIGSVITIAVVIVVALIILGFVSTLLSNIVPLAIVAVVAFILGRMSNNVNLLEVVGNLLRRSTRSSGDKRDTQNAVKTIEISKVTPQQVEKSASVEVPAVTPERQKEAETNLSDFEIKTEDEILNEARLREQEILKKNTAYDPSAALEERKRRLLGDQAGE